MDGSLMHQARFEVSVPPPYKLGRKKSISHIPGSTPDMYIFQPRLVGFFWVNEKAQILHTKGRSRYDIYIYIYVFFAGN